MKVKRIYICPSLFHWYVTRTLFQTSIFSRPFAPLFSVWYKSARMMVSHVRVRRLKNSKLTFYFSLWRNVVAGHTDENALNSKDCIKLSISLRDHERRVCKCADSNFNRRTRVHLPLDFLARYCRQFLFIAYNIVLAVSLWR